MADLTPLSAQDIRRALAARETGVLGGQVHYFPQIGSTNDIARQLAADDAPHGTLVITDEQVKGRGRMGRQWHAPPNTSLLMSLVLRPALAAGEVNRLVMACSLALAEAIARQTGLEVAFKWPNDVTLDGAKLVGILPESELREDRLAWVVVGMGVNVNQLDLPEDVPYPVTSLRLAAGKQVDRLTLLADLLERLNVWYGLLDDDRLDEAWRARLTTLGQRVQAGKVEGTAERVDRSGALWIRTAGGRLVQVVAGEVSLGQETKHNDSSAC